MAKNSKIHIGKLIEKKFNESGMTKTSFATKLCYRRNNIYNIFKKTTIDVELLYRISDALQHNFFEYYTQKLNSESVSN